MRPQWAVGGPMRIFIVTAAALAVSGCMSMGTKFDETQVSGFQIGKTTCTEAVAKLGPPQQDQRSAKGERTVSYFYSDMRSRPENFIPYVGPLVGGMDGDSKNLTLVCNKNDVLEDYTVGTGSTDMNQNLAR